MKMARLKRILVEEHGSEMVEFGLSALLLMTILMGILDVTRAMYAYNMVSHTAQSGARYAMLRGADWASSCNTSAPPSFTMSYGCKASATDVQNYVKSLGMVNWSNQGTTPVTVTWPQTTPDCTSSCSACSTSNNKGCMVKVNVQFKFKFATVFFKQTTVTLSSTAQQVIQQ